MDRVSQLKSMLESTPEDTFLLYALAMEYAKTDEIEQTLEAFDNVLKQDANHVSAYFQKAQYQARQDLVEEAIATTNAGIEVAKSVGDDHALSEMQGFLDML